MYASDGQKLIGPQMTKQQPGYASDGGRLMQPDSAYQRKRPTPKKVPKMPVAKQVRTKATAVDIAKPLMPVDSYGKAR
jgi:hypothetical protein